MTSLEPVLRQHPFFAGLDDASLTLLTGCARNVRFAPGQPMAREGRSADVFYLLRTGRAALGIPSPRGGTITIETLDAGDVIGWSWLFPPHLWQFDVTAVSEVRALALDGLCLRGKCEADPRLGYDLMKRFSRVMAARLAATRLQLLDLYRAGPQDFPAPEPP
jgi:CRP-like cAMP-binding protein